MAESWDDSWTGGSQTFTSSRGRGRGGFRGSNDRRTDQRQTRDHWDGARGGGGNSERIEVPTSKVSRVIGRGGAKIRELEETSGCRIKILKDESTGDKSIILLSGNGIEEAKRLIKEVTEGGFGGGGGRSRGGDDGGWAEQPKSGWGEEWGGGDGGRKEQSKSDWGAGGTGGDGGWNEQPKPDSGAADGDWGQPWANAPKPEWKSNRGAAFPRGPTEKMKVETTVVAKVIGRGGTKIRELEEKSGCRIRVLKEESDGYDSYISITGENIEEAKRLINEVIEPPSVQQSFQNMNLNGESNGAAAEEELIDWSQIATKSREAAQAKWASLPPLKKNFYYEEREVAEANPADVAAFRKNNFDIKVRHHNEGDPRPIPNPVTKFEQAFRKFPEILDEIYKQGFTTPSPIQAQAWPILLQGNDMIGIAQTGTGKTLAFLLPALIHTEHQTIPRSERVGPTVLVLAPTRELAQQIEKESKKYNYRGIQSICIYGGGNRREQTKQVVGVEIVIATPGRLNDLISAGVIDVSAVSYLVLDEADRMLDMGFEPQIRKVLLDIRPDRQTVMTSATWPPGVRSLAEMYMKDPIHVVVGSFDLAAVHSVTQFVEIVEDEEKREMLYDFIEQMGEEDKCIVFVAKKIRADDIASELSLKGVECQCIHGDRDQIDREEALQQLKDGTVRILIATDVASRGLDIKDITHVFNLDFPNNMEEYVHRVGRTGRAGRTGVSITLMTRQDWSKAAELIKILDEAGQEVPDQLVKMAERFEVAQVRRNEERERERIECGGRPRGRGGFGGRGGRGGRRDFESDFGFGGGFGGGGFGGRGGRGGRRDKW